MIRIVLIAQEVTSELVEEKPTEDAGRLYTYMIGGACGACLPSQEVALVPLQVRFNRGEFAFMPSQKTNLSSNHSEPETRHFISFHNRTFTGFCKT